MTLTIFASKIIWAFADVIVDAVDTGATILTDVILTIVNVLRTIDAMETSHTLAGVVGEVIVAFGAICTRIKLVAAKVNLRVAVLTCRKY